MAAPEVTMTHAVEVCATAIFAMAVMHTFAAVRFQRAAHHLPQNSPMGNLLHLLGEVEVIFILWAVLFALAATCVLSSQTAGEIAFTPWGIFEFFRVGWDQVVAYIDSRDYTEPYFVFVVMIIASTKPVIDIADAMIRRLAPLIPPGGSAGFLMATLIFGPLLGSLITEPAAMTIAAIILKRQFMDRAISRRFQYAIIGTLFVNVSIGGVLTHFAAPPVLMVAGKWGWTTEFMFMNFGWKAIIACCINSMMLAAMFRKELRSLKILADSDLHGRGEAKLPATLWIAMAHLLVLGVIVWNWHHQKVFMGAFIAFLGFYTVTRRYQEILKLREAMLVGGFLMGLVTLGGLQSWWLQPLISNLDQYALYFGAAGLTAFTDNAALTYLASQVHGISPEMKYLVVAGAVSGGGLTVIANAPNPAGYGILSSCFGPKGVSMLALLGAAFMPTVTALLLFLL